MSPLIEMSSRKFDVTYLVLATAVVLFGALLRFYGLGVQSFWSDEIATYYETAPRFHSFGSMVRSRMLFQSTPPLYPMMIYGWQRLFGESDLLMRVPSALAGCLGVAGMVAVGRRLYDKATGLVAGLLVSAMWVPVYFSQEARLYALLMALGLLMTFFWVGLWRAVGRDEAWRLKELVPYVLLAVLTSYLHLFGVLLVALQGSWLLWLALLGRRRRLMPLLYLYVGLALSYIPWLVWAAMRFEDNWGAVKWIWRPIPWNFISLTHWWFAYSNRLTAVAALLLLGWLVAFVWRLRRREVVLSAENILYHSSTTWLLLWLVVPVLFAYVASYAFRPIWVDRYFVIIVPALYFLVARAVVRWPLPRQLTPLLALGVIAIFAHHLVFRAGYYATPSKYQFREAAEVVGTRYDSYDDSLVLALTWTEGDESFFNYYIRQHDEAATVQLLGGEDEDIERVAAILDAERPQHVWMMRAHLPVSDDFNAMLQQRYDLLDHEPFFGSEVWLYRLRGS